MASNYSVFWTAESLANLEDIIHYLNARWTNGEVQNFKTKLSNHLKLIQNNPFLFPTSEYNSSIRKAVLSKQTIIFYQVKNQSIFLLYLFVTKKDITKLK